MIGKRHLLAMVATLCMGVAGPARAGQAAAPTIASETQSVRIASEPGVVLAGELSVPAASKAPVPAVLLLGGGGESPHGIYPLLEAKLHARGIATLSFDKRGIGQSTGTFIDAMDPMTHDARAALAQPFDERACSTAQDSESVWKDFGRRSCIRMVSITPSAASQRKTRVSGRANSAMR